MMIADFDTDQHTQTNELLCDAIGVSYNDTIYRAMLAQSGVDYKSVLAAAQAENALDFAADINFSNSDFYRLAKKQDELRDVFKPYAEAFKAATNSSEVEVLYMLNEREIVETKDGAVIKGYNEVLLQSNAFAMRLR